MSLKNLVENIKLMTIIWATGLFLVTLTYFLLHKDLIFHDEIFWIGILLSGMSTYMIISHHKLVAKLVFLFLFGFILYIPHMLSSPNNYHIYDELIHYHTTSMILETGNIDTQSGFIILKYYPTLELLITYFRNMTGGSIFSSGLIIVGIIHSFTIIFLYLFFRNICSEKIASIGTFAYFFNSSYTHFDTYISYESIGLPLLIISLFAISYNKNMSNIKMLFVSLILIIGTVVTHHFSSYILLLFMVILLIIKIFNIKSIENVENRKIGTLTFLTGVLIFGWIIYIASILLIYYNRIFSEAIKGVLGMTLFGDRVTELLSSKFLDVPYYELVIRRFLYTPVIVILILIAIYHLYSKKKIDIYIITLTIFSGLFFLSLFGSLTSSFEIGRFSTYGFIGIAFLIGISIERIQRIRPLKIMAFITVVFLLIGGVSVGTSPPYRGSYSDSIRIGQETITADSLQSAMWFENHMGRRNPITTDIATGTVFEHYGYQALQKGPIWDVYISPVVDDKVLSDLRSNGVYFIIIDNRITRTTSELRYFFDRKELYVKDHPGYGRTKPLPVDYIRKFDNYSIFQEIYDNGNINIYKVMKYQL